ncbi:YhcH/YjgK/YiaL family protein [[Mycoplasma] collis]|uniref:YhcH/YjgK/YiaL family protein n=1 Tax=[Mycoplasma] collis TaxID=2127 RepID=UPI00051B4B5E|nr:YhcH/YjgK/YiaL family protein [[Mycoplasma] collis]
MIYGKIKDLEKYSNLHPNLKIAINWLNNQDIEKLKLGKHTIKNDDIFAIKMEVDTYNENSVQYEIHHIFSDLHIVLEDEGFYYNDELEMGKTKTDYNENDDYILYELNQKNNHFLKTKKGDFLLFLPRDGHAPKYNLKKDKIKKLVIKIKW